MITVCEGLEDSLVDIQGDWACGAEVHKSIGSRIFSPFLVSQPPFLSIGQACSIDIIMVSATSVIWIVNEKGDISIEAALDCILFVA